MLETVTRSVALIPKERLGHVHLSLDLVGLPLAVRGNEQDSHALPYVLLNRPRGQSEQMPAEPAWPGAHERTQLPPATDGGPFSDAS